MEEYTDIPYVENSSTPQWHNFDLYAPKDVTDSAPLLIWAHGGAWRSEDKSKHADLGRRLADKARCPVALPNYRLTTPENQLRHPTHAEDLLAFLHFTLDWAGPKGRGRTYDPTRLYLVGHSCTAHMLTSIYLAPPPVQPAFPTLVPSDRLLAATRGIALGEGIYDVDRLLQSFPKYRDWFIVDTFGDLETFERFNTTSYLQRKGGEHIRWLVLHSTGDTLVDLVQSHSIYESLEKGGVGKVERFWELTLDHNDVLTEDAYVDRVARFLARTEASGVDDGKVHS